MKKEMQYGKRHDLWIHRVSLPIFRHPRNLYHQDVYVATHTQNIEHVHFK